MKILRTLIMCVAVSLCGCKYIDPNWIAPDPAPAPVEPIPAPVPVEPPEPPQPAPVGLLQVYSNQVVEGKLWVYCDAPYVVRSSQFCAEDGRGICDGTMGYANGRLTVASTIGEWDIPQRFIVKIWPFWAEEFGNVNSPMESGVIEKGRAP